MTPKTTASVGQQALEEASRWFVDLRIEDLDARGRAEFDAWLRRSPENIGAYLEVAETYAALPPAGAMAGFDVSALVSDAKAAATVVSLDSPSTGRVDCHGEATTRGRRTGWAIAASFAVLMGGAALLWFTADRGTVYSTAIGEQRSFTLPDGSAISMNARSKIRTHFSSYVRDIELLEGQVLFQVAADKHRAFTVRSAEIQVRALGTQFDVNRKDSGTTVTVLEGRVAVSAPLQGRGREDAKASTVVLPGQQVLITPRAVPQTKLVDLAAATAWKERRLVFEGTSLGDVVDEFNRFNVRPLIIDDPSLVDMRISGVYSSTDPVSLLRFLRDQPGVLIVEKPSAVHLGLE